MSKKHKAHPDRVQRAFRRLMLVIGVIMLGLGLAWPKFEEPVIVFGIPSDLGSISGEAPYDITIRLINFVPTRKLEVRDLGCGCSVKTPKRGMWTMNGLSEREMTISLDPDRLPVGPGWQDVVISGFQNGEPFQFTRRFRYTVTRIRGKA